MSTRENGRVTEVSITRTGGVAGMRSEHVLRAEDLAPDETDRLIELAQRVRPLGGASRTKDAF